MEMDQKPDFIVNYSNNKNSFSYFLIKKGKQTYIQKKKKKKK